MMQADKFKLLFYLISSLGVLHLLLGPDEFSLKKIKIKFFLSNFVPTDFQTFALSMFVFCPVRPGSISFVLSAF
jgi:hypothetical protein